MKRKIKERLFLVMAGTGMMNGKIGGNASNDPASFIKAEK